VYSAFLIEEEFAACRMESLSFTNVQILWISIILFLSFVIAEIIAAYVSNSLALLGDAAAMSVDVFTVSGTSFYLLPGRYFFF
jgi:Co/Zn/Cd efflux system component